jgi:hypothetical protein
MIDKIQGGLMMEAKEFLFQTALGSPQAFMNMVVFPLFSARLAAGPMAGMSHRRRFRIE